MIERFENLTSGVSRIYKGIQRIKRQKMTELGLKGTQVMCIHYLSGYPDGITAAELSRICTEDKAAMSRTLAELEELNLIQYLTDNVSEKKYRTPAKLTPKGNAYAEQINHLILQAVEKCGQDISEEEREVFYRVLFRIAENMEDVI